MADAANKFLSTLTAEQKQTAMFAFDNVKERERFGFVPTEMHPRVGLTIEKMTEPQRQAAHNLLKAGLSQKGYMTTDAIMELESILNLIENPPGSKPGKLERNPLKYYVWVFGTPAAKGTWGWKVEGHHVSLNFTMVNGNMVSAAPHFFGSNPAEVRDGAKKGLRVLGFEEDPGRELVMALDDAQRAKAVINTTAPNDIVTRNESTISALTPTGIAATDLQPKQREMLMRVVDAYVSVMAPDIAADRMAGAQESRARQDHLRVGRRVRAREEALLPRAGPDVPHRVRQHAERRQSRALGVARFHRRLRARFAQGTRHQRQHYSKHETGD